jgi:hypothetical protein
MFQCQRILLLFLTSVIIIVEATKLSPPTYKLRMLRRCWKINAGGASLGIKHQLTQGNEPVLVVIYQQDTF